MAPPPRSCDSAGPKQVFGAALWAPRLFLLFAHWPPPDGDEAQRRGAGLAWAGRRPPGGVL